MIDRYNQSDDILIYLRNQHTGAENAVPSAYIEFFFGITGAALRQIINKLRSNGQPVCSDVNGYFYAKNRNEINNTVTQLLSRTKKITDAAQGLVLSHQIFYDGTEDSL
jgi:biotin operon repressor